MSTQQDLIDQLIDYIDKAILKNSVSNRHVATVLSFLNEKLKDFAEGDTFLRRKQPDSTLFLLQLLGVLEVENFLPIPPLSLETFLLQEIFLLQTMPAKCWDG